MVSVAIASVPCVEVGVLHNTGEPSPTRTTRRERATGMGYI